MKTVAADFRFVVAWKDKFGLGLNGVVEVSSRDLEVERQRREDANVGDLVKALTKKLKPVSEKEGGVRFVESVLLYGRKLILGRPLKSIIPDAPDGCPRLVAKTQFATDELILCGQSLTGKTINVHCCPSDSIANLKQKFMDEWGIPLEQQRLICDGRMLVDGRILSDYKIKNESKIHISLRLRGGGGPLPSRKIFADVTDRANLNEHELSSEAPDWRICADGLNIEGECENRDCKAYREMVIRQYGFDSFNLMTDRGVSCPKCYDDFTLVTCGFYKCVFEGVRSSDRFFISSPWQDVGRSKYHRFDVEEEQGSVEWDSLLVIVKARRDAIAAKVPGTSRSVVVRKNNVCRICWSRFGSTVKKGTVTALCGHSFHCECIAKWSEWCSGHDAMPSCPLCRKPM